MTQTLFAACLITVSLAPVSLAQDVLIGPGGTDVDQIVAARVDPSLAVAIHGDGDLIRTVDGGSSFQPVDTAAAPGLVAASFGPADTCYLASSSRVLVSQNGAATFSVATPPPGQLVTIAASPHTGGEVWALLGGGSIYRSLDFANTWSIAGSLGGPTGTWPRPGIDPHPVHAGEWLVHTGRTLWHTTDSGATFSLDQNRFDPAFILDATLLGSNWIALTEDTSVGLVQTEIRTSFNQGASWGFNGAYSERAFGQFRVNPQDLDEVWVADFRDSFYRSLDGGLTETFLQTSAGEYGVEIAFSSDPMQPALVATPTLIGSMDLAQFEFVRAAGQGSFLPVTRLATDTRNPDHLAVITDSELYETFDRGSTWSELPLPGFVTPTGPDMAFDANGGLWVARAALYRYVSGGWQIRTPSGFEVLAIASSTVSPGTIYAAGRMGGLAVLATTQDAGQNWSFNNVCASCSTRADRLLLIERFGAPDRLVIQWDAERRLEYSDDAGATWTPIGNPNARDAIGGSPRRSERLAYWENGNVRTTSDGFAATSAPLATNFGRGGIAVSGEDPNLLVGVSVVGFTGNFPELGISTDGGLTWTLRPDWASDIDDVCAITMSVDERAVLVAGDTGLHEISLRSEVSTSVCTQGLPNSVGRFADMELVGSSSVAANDVRLEATGLPAYTLCLPVAADSFGLTPGAGGSIGTLCLAGQFGRFVPQAGPSSAAGTFGFQLDLQGLPLSGALVPATAGSRWLFQCWYRDVAGGVPSSHFTGAVDVVWVP